MQLITNVEKLISNNPNIRVSCLSLWLNRQNDRDSFIGWHRFCDTATYGYGMPRVTLIDRCAWLSVHILAKIKDWLLEGCKVLLSCYLARHQSLSCLWCLLDCIPLTLTSLQQCILLGSGLFMCLCMSRVFNNGVKKKGSSLRGLIKHVIFVFSLSACSVGESLYHYEHIHHFIVSLNQNCLPWFDLSVLSKQINCCLLL